MRREYAACMSSGARAEGSGLEARSGVARTQMFVDLAARVAGLENLI